MTIQIEGLRSLPKGIRQWTTPAGVDVLEIHYSADPDKDPDTEKGKLWLQSALKGYVGGMRNPDWQREYEIAWDVMGALLGVGVSLTFDAALRGPRS